MLYLVSLKLNLLTGNGPFLGVYSVTQGVLLNEKNLLQRSRIHGIRGGTFAEILMSAECKMALCIIANIKTANLLTRIWRKFEVKILMAMVAWPCTHAGLSFTQISSIGLEKCIFFGGGGQDRSLLVHCLLQPRSVNGYQTIPIPNPKPIKCCPGGGRG